METKNKGGRPKAITKEIGAKIVELIALGFSLRQICKKLLNDEGIAVTKACILRKAVSMSEDDQWFCDQYTKAMEIRALGFADEIIDISDDGSNDWYETESESGDNLIMKPDTEHINRSRLRIDSRKWVTCKLLPKIYGDKIEHTGKDGAPLMAVLNVGKKPENA